MSLRLILRSGSSRGFHTLGLNYPDSEAVGFTCAASADPDCFWNVRREVITGSNFSTDVAVAVPDSIETRLTKAIAYLNAASVADVNGTVAKLLPQPWRDDAKGFLRVETIQGRKVKLSTTDFSHGPFKTHTFSVKVDAQGGIALVP